MLQIDTTQPAAALPAALRVTTSASSEETTGAPGAFGDVLALLTGHHGGAKTHTRAGGTRSNQSADTAAPFAPTRAVAASKAGCCTKHASRTLPHVPVAVAETDAHAADEKALADNLTSLLALAAAPKTATQMPDPAGGPSCPAADGTTTEASSAPDAAVSEQPPALSELRAPLVAVDRSAFLRDHVRGAQRISTGTSSTGAASASVDNTSATLATIAATLDAADNADQSGAGPKAGAPQTAPRALVVDAESAIDASKKASAPPVPAPVFAPIPAGESRPGDSGSSAKRDGRGCEERFVEVSLPKPGILAPAIGPGFVLPAEVRAEAGHPLPAAEAPAAARADVPADAELPRQIVQAIRMQWADGVGTARITLQPEYLGELSVAIRVEHGAVTASLESNTAAVREWIDGNQTMLRQSLAEHGLHLDKLTVAEEQPQPDWSGNEDPKQKQQQEEARRAQRARRRNDAHAPAFEMVA